MAGYVLQQIERLFYSCFLFAIASTIIFSSLWLGDRYLTQQQIFSNDLMCFRRRSHQLSSPKFV